MSEWAKTPGGVLVPRAEHLAPAGRRPPVRQLPKVGTSARPTYALAHGTTTLRSNVPQQLLAQFYTNIPLLRRTVSVLSQFVGEPELRAGNDQQTEELQAWARTVPVGYVGRGLQTWLVDHLSQALVYGYAVGEAEIPPLRDTVGRLWSYRSDKFYFESDAAGALTIKQRDTVQSSGLNPLTAVSTTYDPQGCDPHGQSLFLALPTVAQTWLDMLFAYRATWRRNGIVSWHWNWEPPETLDDPSGDVGAAVIDRLESGWNDAMKSQAVDGIAKDFFTVGKITGEPLGAKSEVMDIETAKRAIVEELVVATGIPPWLLGYTWSTTERLSQQQADMLLATIDGLRRCVEGAVWHLAQLRQHLAGVPGEVEIEWPAVNLQDATEAAKAKLAEAQAMETTERVYKTLWKNGVVDQAGYAEAVTGSPDVETELDEPADTPEPPEPGTLPGEKDDTTASLTALWDEGGDYGNTFADHCCGE